MLENVRDLLKRLRPAELDELGLAASLNSLVSGWNARGGGQCQYSLNIVGACAVLPEPLTITLFRIVQECLTNIAKHASAVNTNITLTITTDSVALTVKDDGSATKLPFADNVGIGLLGIRERVTALDGRLSLAMAVPHGLIVEVHLPIPTITEEQA